MIDWFWIELMFKFKLLIDWLIKVKSLVLVHLIGCTINVWIKLLIDWFWIQLMFKLNCWLIDELSFSLFYWFNWMKLFMELKMSNYWNPRAAIQLQYFDFPMLISSFYRIGSRYTDGDHLTSFFSSFPCSFFFFFFN